jgi:hypothetical protein
MNWKRIVAAAAVILGILAVAGIGVGRLFLDQWYRFEPIPTDPTDGIVRMIETNGFTPQAVDAVHRLQLPAGVTYAYVVEATGDRRVLAANPPELEGKSEKDLMNALLENRLQAEAARVKAPDDREYKVGSARTQPTLPRVGAPIFLAGLVAAALAWLALAAWIYLDARQRGSTAAPGWALLGLLASPLALAVWLISRRGQDTVETATTPPVCPGCGADTVKDAAFCVRCGFALHPSCPECRRLVQTDWSYCATCGRSLSE